MKGSALALIILAQLALMAVCIWSLRGSDLRSWGMSRWAIVLAALGTASATIFLLSEPPYLFSDFRKAYYPAAVAILEGPSSLGTLIKGVHGFVNLPSVAYLFAPLGLLTFKWAAILFFVAGAAATLWAWHLLSRDAQLGDRDSFILLLLFALNGPLINSVREGNTSHFMLLGLAASFIMLRSGRQTPAGVVLGLCALIKLPLLIFGPYLLLRQKWHATAAFAGVLATAAALSLLVFGWENNLHWFQNSVLQTSSSPIGGFNNQSFPGVLLRWENGEALLRNWTGQPVDPMQRYAATALVLAMMAVAVSVGARRPQPQNNDEGAGLEFALVTTLAVISSPISWTHYYCWLLVPAAYFLNPRSILASNATARGLAWAAIFLSTPAVLMPAFENHLANQIYAKALVSHYLLGGLIWFGLLLWGLARLARQSSPVRTGAIA